MDTKIFLFTQLIQLIRISSTDIIHHASWTEWYRNSCIPHKFGQLPLQNQADHTRTLILLIFFLLYPSFILSLDMILFPVFMVRVSVKHMVFGLNVKGKMISLTVSSSLGKNHAHVQEFYVAAIRIETWHTRCRSTWQIQKSADNDLRLLPPSKEALHQYIYCASYQAGYLWRECVRTRYSWPWAMGLENRH